MSVQRRKKPLVRPSSKAVVLEGRRGSKSQFRASVVPTDVRKRAYEVAKAVTAEMSNREARSLARKKRLSATLSAGGGVAGITGFGLMVRKKPKAALWASTTGGLLGGANALLNTPIQRAEARAIDPKKVRKQDVVYLGRKQRKKQHKNKIIAQTFAPLDPYGVLKSMPTGLAVPRGLMRQRRYAASGIRTTQTGRLVRVKAGVR